MSNIATPLKRLFLRNLFWDVEETGDSLANVLKAAAKARFEATATGKVLVSTSGNGHASSFSIPDEFTAIDAAEMVSELLDRYDEARSKLVNDDDIDSPTDTQIKDEMMEKLVAVRGFEYDFDGIRETREEVTT